MMELQRCKEERCCGGPGRAHFGSSAFHGEATGSEPVALGQHRLELGEPVTGDEICVELRPKWVNSSPARSVANTTKVIL
jgi:hypothetical protein